MNSNINCLQRTTPTKITKNQILLGYLSGFIDGEGSIFAPCPKRHRFPRTIVLKIGNTHWGALKFLQKNFGGNLTRKRAGKRAKKYHRILVWKGIGTKIILKQVLPFLIIKKKQAELALKYPIGELRGVKLPQKNRILRKKISDGIRKLNKKEDKNYEAVISIG